jgi:polysaccharide export outer membrane protein
MMVMSRCVGLVFALAVLVSLPVSGLGAGAREYHLGDGDVVRVSVYGQPDLKVEERISAGGYIHFPLLGRVGIGGLSSLEAAQLIAKRLEREGFVRAAHVSLLVTEYNSLQLSVLGEVNRPGRVVLDRGSTIPEVLAEAGGIATSGGERLVLMRTDDAGRQLRREYRLTDLFRSEKQAGSDLWVQAGDVIFVPPADQFYIYGQVNKPGAYRLMQPLNVMQAISVGGGFNGRANTRRISLYRKQADGTVRELKAEPAQTLQDGDVLFVRESMF